MRGEVLGEVVFKMLIVITRRDCQVTTTSGRLMSGLGSAPLRRPALPCPALPCSASFTRKLQVRWAENDSSQSKAWLAGARRRGVARDTGQVKKQPASLVGGTMNITGRPQQKVSSPLLSSSLLA